jgi:hypothetical protein
MHQPVEEENRDALERNSNKSRKLRSINKQDTNEEDLEELDDEEMEMLKSVLDGLKENKKRLH